MKNPLILFLLTGLLCTITSCKPISRNSFPGGTPFSDEEYSGRPQKIPGKIQCEYFDAGGEGIACHDTDSINSGSGRLNPDDGSYLNTFRMNEAVDISYTKMDDRMIDNNPYNFYEPEPNSLYVGWTAEGEWTNYTLQIAESGMYKTGLMYTANQDGIISMSMDKKDITGEIKIPSTFVKEDSLAWRQWHHWNYIEFPGEFKLEKGVHLLTLHTVAVGQMNYDFLVFRLKED